MLAFVYMPATAGGSMPGGVFVALMVVLGCVFAPQAVPRTRRVLAGVLLALVLSASAAVFADDGDLYLARPKQCDSLTWSDPEWWIPYACYQWMF